MVATSKLSSLQVLHFLLLASYLLLSPCRLIFGLGAGNVRLFHGFTFLQCGRNGDEEFSPRLHCSLF